MPESKDRQNQRCGATNEQHPPPPRRHVQAEREHNLRDTGDQQVNAEEDSGDDDGISGQQQHEDAEDQRQQSGYQRRLPQMRQQPWDSSGFHARIFPQSAIAVGDFDRSQTPAGCVASAGTPPTPVSGLRPMRYQVRMKPFPLTSMAPRSWSTKSFFSR